MKALSLPVEERSRGLNLQIGKAAAGILGFWISAIERDVPEAVQVATLVMIGLILLDTLTGVAKAFCCREARSRTMTLKLLAKSAQYAILVGLGGGAAALSQSWTPVFGAVMAIIGIESLSLLENLVRLERCGGVPLGPARPFLQRVGKYLVVGQEGHKEDETLGRDSHRTDSATAD